MSGLAGKVALVTGAGRASAPGSPACWPTRVPTSSSTTWTRAVAFDVTDLAAVQAGDQMADERRQNEKIPVQVVGTMSPRELLLALVGSLRAHIARTPARR